jgi:Family of unknown function (DUF6152)
MYRTSLIIVTLLALATGAMFAHHSLGATYDDSKEIKLEGKIAQFLMRNPHSFLHVEAPDERGVMQRWSLEWRAAGSLASQGVKRDTFQVGDEVTVTISPSRTAADHRGVLKTLKRKSDGMGWGTREGEVVE